MRKSKIRAFLPLSISNKWNDIILCKKHSVFEIVLTELFSTM